MLVHGSNRKGINVEQRRRLSIAIEMAAKPALLLFLGMYGLWWIRANIHFVLDEPTSGLDSQIAWSICQLLRNLANRGQAILCTIHQPSALLFPLFDRLLLLAEGGQTLYCGDIGPNAKTVISYFQKEGARLCRPEENPAEWMIEATTDKEVSSSEKIDWKQKWLNSTERKDLKTMIASMNENLPKSLVKFYSGSREFGASSWTQIRALTARNLKQDWRTPSYLASKVLLSAGSVSCSLYQQKGKYRNSQHSGILRWILLLGRRQQYPGSSRPSLLCLSTDDNPQQLCTAHNS